MPDLQPTVRQLQPLGRHYPAPIVREEVAAHALTAETASPDATTRAPRRRRWRHRLTARPSASS